MHRSLRFFLFVEFALLVVLGYQIMTNPPALCSLIAGIVILVIGVKVHFWHTFWLLLGTILVGVAVFINPTIWIMLFIAVAAALLLLTGKNAGSFFAVRKHFLAVTTTEPKKKANCTTRRAWFGDQTIGNTLFEWDNINMTVAAGDTIIDLGNTFLPKGNNVVVIRKGFGKTRILVPVGIGVAISHSTLLGTLTIDGKDYSLTNESIEHFSKDYDDASRKIHIITNVLVGDVEVIAV